MLHETETPPITERQTREVSVAVTREGGESFNGNIVLGPITTYAGPTATVGAQATVSGTLNDDGAVAAIQIEIQEADDEFEEGDTQGTGDPTQGTREIRIQLEDANGDLKEVIIIIQ